MSRVPLLLVALAGVELVLSQKSCEETMTVPTSLDLICPVGNCGTTACSEFLASIDEDAYAEIEAGFATCTNGYEEYGDGGQYEGQLRTVFIGRANGCGVKSGLSKTPCEESMEAIFSKTDIACPSAPGAPGQSSHTPESCGTTACAEYLSSIDDDAYAELKAKLATCTNGYEEYGDGGQYEGQLRNVFIIRANECGVESGLSKTPCEESMEAIFSKTDIACPSAPGHSSHSPKSCGTTACAEYLSSIDDDAYAEIEAGLATCTNGNEIYGEGGRYEGQLRTLLIDRANECGVESGLSKTPCDKSMGAFSKSEIACPSVCEDGDQCQGKNCCAPGQSSHTPESCFTTACAGYLFSIDDAYAEIEAGLATCTNGYEKYGDGGKQEGYLRKMLKSLEKECGFQSVRVRIEKCSG
jgi:hypothetical protein